MADRHLKVLLIEDNPGDVRLIWEILAEVRNSPFYLEVADRLLSGLQAIEKSKPDVILLDLSLPDSNGIYTLNRVRDKAPDVPVVILTGMDDELTAIKTMKEGAQDYLVKGRTDSDLLRRSLLYAYERNRLFIEFDKNKEELAKSYARLEQMDTMRAAFMSKISSELIEPLVDIKDSVAQMKEKKTKCSPAETKKIKSIKNNVDRLFELVSDMLDVARIETGAFSIKKESVDIAAIIGDAIESLKPMADEKKVKIVSDLMVKEKTASVDAYRIRNAVTNLIRNAVRFSGPKQEVRVGLSDETIEGKPYVKISVKDQGAGIENKDLDKIFVSFFQGREETDLIYKGAGVGLSIVKSIVEAHGGRLWAESEGRNKGSTFYISLPA